jgi:DNA-binding transcriptional LysR family regulator
VIELDQLAALDCALWLGSGTAAAQLLHVNQSTVSRQVRSVLDLMDLEWAPQQGFPQVWGNSSLLQAERQVHQVARLKGFAPLRIAANYASGPWFLQDLPEGWVTGSFDLPGKERPLQLLRDRVIDAWLCNYQPDLPDPDHPEWWVLDLLQEPLQLLAAPDHPLAGERRPSQGDLERFPSLALPSGWFPRTEACLRERGLWRAVVEIHRYDPASWEGRCSDGVTLSYGQSLTEVLQPVTVRLDVDLGLVAGDALVVRRDLISRPAIQQLAELLLARARVIASRFDDVEVPGSGPSAVLALPGGAVLQR